MTSKRQLAKTLSNLAGFDHPRVDLEQYQTPGEIVAHLIHLADLQGDIAGRTVIDLGTGPGGFAIGAALRGAERVIGLERDRAALEIARTNAARVTGVTPIAWIRGDAMRAPLQRVPGATVIMNPPFGAQQGNRHADRAFLTAANALGRVSYSIHNAGSRSFIESFVPEAGGAVTDSYELTMPLPPQFDFHRDAEHEINAECYRIVWAETA